MKFHLKYINLLANELYNIQNMLPVQVFVIFNILEASDSDDIEQRKRHQLVILPTGTGKTLCFQIPILLVPHPSLIVYPLHSLIQDQYRRFRKTIATEILVGGMTKEKRSQVFENLKSGKTKCLLTNPETLQRYSTQLAKQHFSLVVLDEAHCISKWGRNFRPSYKELGATLTKLHYDCCAAFTATASETVIQDIRSLAFCDEEVYVLRGDADRANISYSVLYCAHKDIVLTQLLRRPRAQKEVDKSSTLLATQSSMDPVERPAIVFCNTRNECRRLALELSRQGETKIFFYHAGLTKDEKKLVEERFFESSDAVLFATCAYGMGVDKSDIRTVIHVNKFRDVESYLQESGRAGRDRKPARAIQLCDFDNTACQVLKHNFGNRKGCTSDSGTQDIFTRYQLSSICRREFLLKQLQSTCENCAGCDLCSGFSFTISFELLLLLRYIERNQGLYTIDYFIQHKLDHVYTDGGGVVGKAAGGVVGRAAGGGGVASGDVGKAAGGIASGDVGKAAGGVVSGVVGRAAGGVASRDVGKAAGGDVSGVVGRAAGGVVGKAVGRAASRSAKQGMSLKHRVFTALSTWTTPQLHSVFETLLSLQLLSMGRFFWKRKLFLSKKGKRFLSLLEKAQEKYNESSEGKVQGKTWGKV